MTDEAWYLLKNFGKKINAEIKRKLYETGEKERFTEVDRDGFARPVLRIRKECGFKKGRRRLTAVYSDERQKINRPSLNRTWLIFGSKCYVHCPTIYQPTNIDNVNLIANLFSNNRPVPGGYATFQIDHRKVSPRKLLVENGHLEETHHRKIPEPKTYECNYEGSETWQISIGDGEGVIIPVDETKTSLIVDVGKIILNENETGKLIARVYLRYHENVVNYPEDVPESGTITFYIDGEKYSEPIQINKNGFVTIPYSATHGVGVHTITAVYEPDTEKMKELYQTTSGSNTLFIGTDKNRPTFSQIGLNCGAKGETYEFKFNSSRKITGKLRIFIDGTSIHASECVENGTYTLFGNTQNLYEQEVNNVSSFKFTITIPNYKDLTPDSIWGYNGYHNMIIQFIEPADNTDTDEILSDMEYWYYWDDFFIQVSTKIYIDDTFIDNTDDEGKFTGNNMYIENANGTFTHFKPTTNQIPKSISVGNPLKIHVENDDTGEPVMKGTVKATITTRKKETWVD